MVFVSFDMKVINYEKKYKLLITFSRDEYNCHPLPWQRLERDNHESDVASFSESRHGLIKMKEIFHNASAMCFAHAQFLMDNQGNYIFLKLRCSSIRPGGAIFCALRYSIRKNDFNISNDFFVTLRANDKKSHPQVQNLKTCPILCFLFYENRLRNGRAPKWWNRCVADDTDFWGARAAKKWRFLH